MESRSGPTETLISIVIPFYYKRRKYLEEFFEHLSRLRYSNYEVIVVSNIELDMKLPDKVRVVVTDGISQGEKFDAGIAAAVGEICALIGDDTYPHPDWLVNAVRYFSDPDVIAVGGPGLTPPNDSIMQHASGLVYSSLMGGGFASFRYSAKKERLCDDLPATNLLVRRDALLKVGGISAPFRSGEDTILCMKLSKLGKKMLYAPNAIVFHHRRALFIPHARQVLNAAIHRGYFAKRFGGNSRKARYSLPSLGLISLCTAFLLTFFIPQVLVFLLTVVSIYVIAAILSALVVAKRPYLTLVVFLGIVLTHLVYGVGFLRGLLLRDEKKLLHRD